MEDIQRNTCQREMKSITWRLASCLSLHFARPTNTSSFLTEYVNSQWCLLLLFFPASLTPSNSWELPWVLSLQVSQSLAELILPCSGHCQQQASNCYPTCYPHPKSDWTTRAAHSPGATTPSMSKDRLPTVLCSGSWRDQETVKSA